MAIIFWRGAFANASNFIDTGKGDVSCPGTLYVQSQELARKVTTDAVRKENLAQKFELAKGAQRIKERQQDIDMAKLRNVSSKVELRARQADLKEARAKLVGDKSKKAEDEARRIQTPAAQTCQRIRNWHKEKPERFASLKANIKKGLLKPSAKAVKTASK